MVTKLKKDTQANLQNNFNDYALTRASRLKSGETGGLERNQQKLYAKAFHVLRPQVQKAARILDFGCGAGEFIQYLLPISTGQLVGFDPSRTQLDIARATFVNASRVRLLNDWDSLEGEFDLIFCHHVIEHVKDAELAEFVARLSSLLKADGSLIIATPNGLNPNAYAFFMSTDLTHVRMHSPFSLAQALQPVGLDIVSIHRESPQAYDLITTLRFVVWKVVSFFTWIKALTVASGIRGLRFPIVMWGSFFIVAKKT